MPVFRIVGVAGDAAGVGQEVVDRHALPRLRRVVDVLADRILDLELAPLLEDEDRHRRELLGDRPQAELGLRRVGDLVLGVGEAVALAEEGLAVLRDEDRAAEVVHLDAGVHVLLEPGRHDPRPSPRRRVRRRSREGERAGKGAGSFTSRLLGGFVGAKGMG